MDTDGQDLGIDWHLFLLPHDLANGQESDSSLNQERPTQSGNILGYMLAIRTGHLFRDLEAPARGNYGGNQWGEEPGIFGG